jgi:predicted dinucleotide-binding enzyme
MVAALSTPGSENNAVYVAGDDAAAKRVVGDLVASLGGEAVDTGDLRTGGRLQGGGGAVAGRLEMQTPAAARDLVAQAR